MFKKKKMPVLAITVGALAAFGAYSMARTVKECCLEKMKKMACILKKHGVESTQTESTEDKGGY